MSEKRTLHGHSHGEAFMVMTYRADDGSEEERIWNSRDGVTPFMITLRSGKQASHVDWYRDEYRPDYVPAPGSRMFVDMTEERARELARRNADLYFARAAEDPDYPSPRTYGFATPEEMAEMLAAEALARPGQPDLVEAPSTSPS